MMAYKLFIAVVLSTCLQLTAQARTPLRTLPLSAKLKFTDLAPFYQSLHDVLGKRAIWNKAEKEYLDLQPLQKFLQGKTLAPEMREDLEAFGEEYSQILGNKVDIADLLKYSEQQAQAEQRSDPEYIRLVDSVIKDLPAKKKLYLFTLKLTLADDTEVTLIKPGMSKPTNITKRVKEQINLLNKIAHDLEGIKFNIDGRSLAVKEMRVKQVNLGDNKQKYLDLNYGVTDRDVHRQLVAKGYRMVHGIPNKEGGKKKEVFVKQGGEDSSYVEDIAAALADVQAKTYLARWENKNGLNGTGISLSLPDKTTAEFLFADIYLNAASFKDKRMRLAKMLFEIKWYEYKYGHKDDINKDKVFTQQLHAKFNEIFDSSTANLKKEVKQLSKEVFVVRKIISAIQEAEGGSPADVARRLGLGSLYGYADHLREGLDTSALVSMGITINNKYAEHQALFDELLDLRGETEKVNEAIGLLQEGIDIAGGWSVFQSAMQTDVSSAAGLFRKALAAAALKGEPAERLAEVVLLYTIISAIPREEEELVTAVASRLGLGVSYTYKSHLEERLDTGALVAMGVTINDKLPEHQALFDELLDLRGETEKVNEAIELLQEGISIAGDWSALQSTMQKYNSIAAGKFHNALVDAALRGEPAERLAEVVLLYIIIAAIPREEEELVTAVASRLGLGVSYTYKSHLEERLDTGALVAMGVTINDKLPEHQTLFDELLDLRGETEKVNEAIGLLQEGINIAGGWSALQSAMQTDVSSAAGLFRNNLAAAAVRGEPAEHIAEVVLFYRIISAIQAVEGGIVAAVASILRLGGNYSYVRHLEEGLDTAALVSMGITINNEFSDHQALFDELLDLRGETEKTKVREAMQLLNNSIINMAGGWSALQDALQTVEPNAAVRFHNNLVDAALRRETAKRIAEVVLIYRIISPIQAVTEEEPRAVASILGLGRKYSYVSHLEEGRTYDLQKLIDGIKDIKKEHEDKAELRNTLDYSIELLKNLKKPKQLELPLAAG